MSLKPLLDFQFTMREREDGTLVPSDEGKYTIRIQISADGRLWVNKVNIPFGEFADEDDGI